MSTKEKKISKAGTLSCRYNACERKGKNQGRRISESLWVSSAFFAKTAQVVDKQRGKGKPQV